MKLRIESEGLHYFDRKTGLHLLVDEIQPEVSDFSIAPRTVSIAITNCCNADCYFCHVKKGNQFINSDIILFLCKQLDKYGTFDIALGGGEPTIHKDFVDICRRIWTETNLGLSVTTNGHLLTSELIDGIKGYISFLRISIDSSDSDTYKKIRNKELNSLLINLKYLNGKIPFGINMVINSDTIKYLNEMIPFVREIGGEELLILPNINNNKFCLEPTEWKTLENWINYNYKDFPIRILERARKKISSPVLFDNDNHYDDYLYISADLTLMNSSYDESGINLDLANFDKQLIYWRNKMHGRQHVI